jgi:hypothetical protein
VLIDVRGRLRYINKSILHNWHVLTKFATRSTYENKVKFSIAPYVRKHLICELQLNEYRKRARCPPWDSALASTRLAMARRVSPKMAGQFRLVRQPPTVPVPCQQELHTQGLIGVPTGKNAEDWGVEAMQGVLLYLPIGQDRRHREHLAQHGCSVPEHHHACIESSSALRIARPLRRIYFWYSFILGAE